MHAGEGLLIRISAARSGRVIDGGQVTAEFWAPGRDPVTDPAVRATPDHQAGCDYDPFTRRWTARVPFTAGWPPGTWTVRGRASGEDWDGWAWQTFPLAA
jgi:hypothetical protein